MTEPRWIIRSVHNPRLFCCPGTALWWPLDEVSAFHAVPAPSAVAMDLPCGGIWSPLSEIELAPVPARIRDTGIELVVDVGGWVRGGAGVQPGADRMDEALAFLERAGNPSLVRAMRSGWRPGPSSRLEVEHTIRQDWHARAEQGATEDEETPSLSLM